MNLSKRAYIIIIGAVALIALYFIFDPMEARWMPKCPVKWTTGLSCPGCGSQRFLHAILHGDLAGAAASNALLFAGFPFLFLLLLAGSNPKRFPRLFRMLNSPVCVISACVIIVAWTIVRNILNI